MTSNTPEWILELEKKIATDFFTSSDFSHDNTCFTEENYIQVINGLGLFGNDMKKYLQSKNLQYDAKITFDEKTRIKVNQNKQGLDHKFVIDLLRK
jgi:hypothetical protein